MSDRVLAFDSAFAAFSAKVATVAKAKHVHHPLIPPLVRIFPPICLSVAGDGRPPNANSADRH